jgi:copper chaperone CopZ
MTELTLHLGGVSCGGCANRVNQALVAVPGVATAVVNEERTQVVVSGAVLERSALVAAVEHAGYQVLSAASIPLQGI